MVLNMMNLRNIFELSENIDSLKIKLAKDEKNLDTEIQIINLKMKNIGRKIRFFTFENFKKENDVFIHDKLYSQLEIEQIKSELYFDELVVEIEKLKDKIHLVNTLNSKIRNFLCGDGEYGCRNYSAPSDTNPMFIGESNSKYNQEEDMMFRETDYEFNCKSEKLSSKKRISKFRSFVVILFGIILYYGLKSNIIQEILTEKLGVKNSIGYINDFMGIIGIIIVLTLILKVFYESTMIDNIYQQESNSKRLDQLEIELNSKFRKYEDKINELEKQYDYKTELLESYRSKLREDVDLEMYKFKISLFEKIQERQLVNIEKSMEFKQIISRDIDRIESRIEYLSNDYNNLYSLLKASEESDFV